MVGYFEYVSEHLHPVKETVKLLSNKEALWLSCIMLKQVAK
jgi:hypothetical protein